MRFPSTVVLALVCVAAFGCPPPGKGAKAERGYAQAEPIISALDAYHRTKKAYPDSLSQLVPDYLAPAAYRAPVEYRKLQGDDYDVSFRYSGPGMNECEYRGSSRKWSCSGYF